MRTRVTKQSRHKNKQKTKTNNKTKDRDGNPKGSDTLYPLSIYLSIMPQKPISLSTISHVSSTMNLEYSYYSPAAMNFEEDQSGYSHIPSLTPNFSAKLSPKTSPSPPSSARSSPSHPCALKISYPNSKDHFHQNSYKLPPSCKNTNKFNSEGST